MKATLTILGLAILFACGTTSETKVETFYGDKITSENLNKVILTDSNATIGSNSFYSTYVTSQALVEGGFYMVEIQNTTDSKLIFRDKVFCTNQASSTYEMTSGVYTQHNTGANEYKYYSAP